MAGELPGKPPFLDHNRELIARIEDLENKTRRRDLLVDEETLFRFYDNRVPNIADAASLNKLLKDRGGDHFLRMSEGDLLEAVPGLEIQEQFPNFIEIGDIQLPLRYAFHPGAEDDGVTVTIPLHALPNIPMAPFDWLVPGLLPEKILLMLKALPKSLRRHLVPVGTAAERLLGRLSFREGNLDAQMSRGVFELAGIEVPLTCWDQKSLPLHLQMRFEVIGPEGRVLGSGRDLSELMLLAADRHEDRIWEEARKTWERVGLTSWDFGDLPQRIELGKDRIGLTVYAYPALASEGQTAAIRLLSSPDAAKESSVNGLLVLYQWAFAAELKQLKRNWGFPNDLAAMSFFMGSRQEATRSLQLYLLRELFDLHSPQAPDRRHFQATRERLQGRIGALSQELLNELFEAITERHACSSRLQRLRKLSLKNQPALVQLDLILQELEELVPADFMGRYRRAQIRILPRYLKALQIRAERAYVAPEKDRLKAEQLLPFHERYERLKREMMARPSVERSSFLDELRWMVEEFKVSLFAPEIKVLFRISAKRLEDKFAEWQTGKDTA